MSVQFSRVLFIANPHAGVQRNIRPRVIAACEKAGMDFAIEETQYAGHATELATGASEMGFDLVVAIGGDGTLTKLDAHYSAQRCPWEWYPRIGQCVCACVKFIFLIRQKPVAPLFSQRFENSMWGAWAMPCFFLRGYWLRCRDCPSVCKSDGAPRILALPGAHRGCRFSHIALRHCG